MWNIDINTKCKFRFLHQSNIEDMQILSFFHILFNSFPISMTSIIHWRYVYSREHWCSKYIQTEFVRMYVHTPCCVNWVRIISWIFYLSVCPPDICTFICVFKPQFVTFNIFGWNLMKMIWNSIEFVKKAAWTYIFTMLSLRYVCLFFSYLILELFSWKMSLHNTMIWSFL